MTTLLPTEANRQATMNPAEALELIRRQGGRFFGVSFLKRSDGTVRHMTARSGVTKGLTPDPARREYDRPAKDAACGCLTVYDVSSHGYRRIPLDAILAISAAGERSTPALVRSVRDHAEAAMASESRWIRNVPARSMSRAWRLAYAAGIRSACRSWREARAVLRAMRDAGEMRGVRVREDRRRSLPAGFVDNDHDGMA